MIMVDEMAHFWSDKLVSRLVRVSVSKKSEVQHSNHTHCFRYSPLFMPCVIRSCAICMCLVPLGLVPLCHLILATCQIRLELSHEHEACDNSSWCKLYHMIIHSSWCKCPNWTLKATVYSGTLPRRPGRGPLVSSRFGFTWRTTSLR